MSRNIQVFAFSTHRLNSASPQLIAPRSQTLKDGRVQQTNFHDYKLLRMPETPKIEMHIVKSTEKPGGIGEPGMALLSPVVANAVFALTGKRLRKMPFSLA